MKRAAFLLTLAAAVPVSQAHRVPDMWMTGQRLVDLFDPTVKPKTLFWPDRTFVADLPENGWRTDVERIRHVEATNAENGRTYINAVFDGGRGKSFCFNESDRPDDETFYEDVIRDLHGFSGEQLKSRSAFDLIVEVWRKRWPCTQHQRRKE